jgi:hypothetical protein
MGYGKRRERGETKRTEIEKELAPLGMVEVEVM